VAVTVSIIAIVLIGIVGYGAIGFAYATTRVSSADKTLNLVVSHQNTLNSTFKAIDSNFSTLSSSSTFNPVQARAATDAFVASATSAVKVVDQDDASLASASSSLTSNRWLTVVNRGSIDKESVRVGHARKALASARTIASGYVLDGQFEQAFMDTLIDLDTVSNQSVSSDFAGAKTTLGTMKTHVDRATQLSGAPGLPPDLHPLMVDVQTLVTDFGKLVDAAQAGDDAGIAANRQSVQDDANKIGTYNFDQINTGIDAYYKPLVDRFNSEMAAATA
jgi:hypothetical protein